MKEFNVMFTSAGRRVSLINHFRNTLKDLGLSGKIITVDINSEVPSAIIADYFVQAPKVTDEGYIDFIKEVAIKYDVKLIIPLIDTELMVLAKNKEWFSKAGITLLISSTRVIEISNDKRLTYMFFKENKIRSARTYEYNLSLFEDIDFPCVIKPANGSSSKGFTIVKNTEELNFYYKHIENPIVQEYIDGEEYTVDVLVDFAGRVSSVVPRLRIETRAGESIKGVSVKNYKIINETKNLVELLDGAVGCITVQCFLTKDNEIIFNEINPRFAGGIPLTLKAGADYPRYIIQLILGEELNIGIDEWEEGIVMLRYSSEIWGKSSPFMKKI